MEIHFPLFVRAMDSGEIWKFNSVHELQAHVEKIDIENAEYEAWDSGGLPVGMKLQEPVWISLHTVGGPSDSDRLRRALVDFGMAIGIRLPDDLPVGSFEAALGQIKDAQEKRMLDSSPLRRFLKSS